MQQISANRRRAYLTALSQEIQKKLQRAETTPSQRRNLLQELFADIALEVDDRAKDIILSRGADTIAPSEEGLEDHLCFYDVLSGHFIQVPEDGQPILDLIVKLWSQSFASHIFALLFHKWGRFVQEVLPNEHIILASALLSKDICKGYNSDLKSCEEENKFFEVEIEDSEKLLRYSSALVQGSANVFWMDIQTNTRRFQSLFRYLLEDVTLNQSRVTKLVLQAQRDLFLLLSRFIFFYNAVNRLGDFLNKFPTFPNSFLVGGPADLFVIELTDQLQKLKVEPVLLHYLSQIKFLEGLELRMTTSTRLKTCLYSFTCPGGPMYPTRTVRHSAWDTLDALFPVGQYPRHLISFFFRLLYPWYWPSSCWHFVISCIKAVFYSLIGLIVSSWDVVRGHKMSKRDM